MGSKARVKVKSRYMNSTASDSEKSRNLSIMYRIFKKAVNESGILNKIKEKQFFETKGQKLRRKRKESLAKIRNEKNFNN